MNILKTIVLGLGLLAFTFNAKASDDLKNQTWSSEPQTQTTETKTTPAPEPKTVVTEVTQTTPKISETEKDSSVTSPVEVKTETQQPTETKTETKIDPSKAAVIETNEQPKTATACDPNPVPLCEPTEKKPVAQKTIVHKKRPVVYKKPAPQPVVATTTPVVTNTEVQATNFATTPQEATTTSDNPSNFMHKGKNIISLGAHGYYEMTSTYENLYVKFATRDINTAGFGFFTGYEYGLSDHLSIGLDMGYSRLTYSNKFKNVIKQNFFNTDILGRYYFLKDEKIAPFVSFGGGVAVSSAAAIPTFNAGGGVAYKLSENIFLKAELLAKSAVVFNRFEARVGVGFHF